MIIPTQPNFNVVNTADYRETYANSVQVRVNVWDFFLVFGTMQQQTENQVEVRNFQGIYLSPQQAKALAAILNQNVTNYESTFGEIKLDPRAARPGSLKTLATDSQLGPAKTAALFVLFAAVLIGSHIPLLQLPYFWDEAGYYVPAARDLLAGSLIPHSTP